MNGLDSLKNVVTDMKKKEAERKELIGLIQKLRKQGLGLQRIANKLNEFQIPTLSGTGKWYGQSVQYLLMKK